MADLTRLDEDGVVLAAEYSLGLLEGDALAQARRRMLSNTDFAAAVEWWDLKFNQMHAHFADVPPPSAMWAAIESRLTGQDNEEPFAPTTSRVWRKRAAGFVGLLVGAAVMLYIGSKLDDPVAPMIAEQPEQPAAGAAQLFASLDGGETGPSVSTRLDPDSGRLAVRIAGVPQDDLGPDRAPELWVVPAGGAPQSLGLLPYEGDFSRDLSDSEAALFVEGATVAVTYEDRATAPHPAPTSDIVAAGQLVQI